MRLYFAVAAIFLATSASAELNSLVSTIESTILQSSFSSGRNQILAADISPACRQLAFVNLAAAEKNSRSCHFMDYVDDTAAILDSTIDAIGNLSRDLDTVINGFPTCFTDYSWINIPGIIGCLIGEVKPIWTASSNFIHFTNYYQIVLNDIKELMSCFEGSKTNADISVKKIVDMAKMCKMQ